MRPYDTVAGQFKDTGEYDFQRPEYEGNRQPPASPIEPTSSPPSPPGYPGTGSPGSDTSGGGDSLLGFFVMAGLTLIAIALFMALIILVHVVTLIGSFAAIAWVCHFFWTEDKEHAGKEVHLPTAWRWGRIGLFLLMGYLAADILLGALGVTNAVQGFFWPPSEFLRKASFLSNTWVAVKIGFIPPGLALVSLLVTALGMGVVYLVFGLVALVPSLFTWKLDREFLTAMPILLFERPERAFILNGLLVLALSWVFVLTHALRPLWH